MHLQYRPGLLRHGMLIICQVRAVGRANFFQAHRGGFDKLWQAKARTDFNQLTAGDDDFLVRR